MSRLTSSQREQLAAVLAEEHQRSVARADALTREFDNIVTASADSVRDDEHDPEGATIAFERAQVAALRTDAVADIAAIERAQAQLAAGAYGICERCGDAIPFERLLARPGTTRCVACAAA